MRTLILILFFAAVINLSANTQNIPQSQVPPVIVSSMQKTFAGATDVKWEVKKDLYKAEFKIGSRKHDAWIDKSGTLKKHKEDFPKKDLPAAILQQVEKEFKGYRIDDADKIEEDGKIFYQVDLKGTTEERKVLFTPDGRIEKNEE